MAQLGNPLDLSLVEFAKSGSTPVPQPRPPPLPLNTSTHGQRTSNQAIETFTRTFSRSNTRRH